MGDVIKLVNHENEVIVQTNDRTHTVRYNISWEGFVTDKL